MCFKLPETVSHPINYLLNLPTANVTSQSNFGDSYQHHPSVRMSVSIKPQIVGGTQSLPANVFNFAPICNMRSDILDVSALSPLLGNTDKRTRIPHFQHKFDLKKPWIDVVFVLPYKIVLLEVAIKIPDNLLHNIPSAVQVELSSDPAQSSWHVLSCPVITSPVPHIRLSTQAYKFPVSGKLSAKVI